MIPAVHCIPANLCATAKSSKTKSASNCVFSVSHKVFECNIVHTFPSISCCPDKEDRRFVFLVKTTSY